MKTGLLTKPLVEAFSEIKALEIIRQSGFDAVDFSMHQYALSAPIYDLPPDLYVRRFRDTARVMKDLGLIPEGYKIMIVGSVQEEDCDGMCWQYIVNKYFNGPEDAASKIDFVISTEPTDGGVYRGHRGRMEIRVDVKGVSCHGSAPERGDRWQ